MPLGNREPAGKAGFRYTPILRRFPAITERASIEGVLSRREWLLQRSQAQALLCPPWPRQVETRVQPDAPDTHVRRRAESAQPRGFSPREPRWILRSRSPICLRNTNPRERSKRPRRHVTVREQVPEWALPVCTVFTSLGIQWLRNALPQNYRYASSRRTLWC
jgi:hypothetical protein